MGKQVAVNRPLTDTYQHFTSTSVV